MKEFYCTIFGNVQNTGFRRFVQYEAGKFGVTGTIQNRQDGSVEVVAQGDAQKLQTFFKLISVGPEEAQVESVNVSWGVPTIQYSDFSIL